jgi:hypothetical protein
MTKTILTWMLAALFVTLLLTNAVWMPLVSVRPSEEGTVQTEAMRYERAIKPMKGSGECCVKGWDCCK